MEIIGFLFAMAVCGVMFALFVVLPIIGWKTLTHKARTAMYGHGYNLRPADRLRLQRDQVQADSQLLIDQAAERARREAEAARPAAIQRAQSAQQTQNKWV